MGDYATSDGFAQVTGHGVATLSNVVQTAIPWKGLRRATAGVRGVGLSVHALATLTARRRFGGSNVVAVGLLALFAAAGATYAAAFVVGDGGAPLALIAAAMFGAVSLVMLREFGWWLYLIAVLLALLVPALIWNIREFDGLVDEYVDIPETWVVWLEGRRSQMAVVFAVLGFTVLGWLSIASIDEVLPWRRSKR